MAIRTKKIVTVQDISCYGQCSTTVAQPILSAHGIETAILPSAILSNHTGGFRGYTCLDLTDEMPKIVDQWKTEGLMFDAIYTGYIGNARQFGVIKEMKCLLKEGGKLIVDPAMADHGKLYKALSPDIVDGMKDLITYADIILPNMTEAAMLAGEPWNPEAPEDEIRRLCRKLTKFGPEIAMITGASFESTQIGTMSYNRRTGEYVSYMGRRMPRNYHGTGDVFASMVVSGYLAGKTLYEVQKDACEFVIRCIENTISDETHGYGVKFESVLAEGR